MSITRNQISVLGAIPSVLLLLCLDSAIAAPTISAESKALYDAGYRAAVSGDAKGARAKFEAALAADPKNFLAQFDLGGLAENANDKDAAILAYQRTIEIAPDFAEAQVELATLFLNAKRDAGNAIKHFRIALTTKNPYLDSRFSVPHTRGQALRNLAVSYAVKGQLGLAQGIARSFLSDLMLDHDGDEAMQTLLTRSSGPMKKLTERKYADELQPISKRLHGGKPAEALAVYLDFETKHSKESLLATDSWDLYEGIGLAQAFTNRFDESSVAFEKSQRAAFALPYAQLQESQYNLACSLASAGKSDEAIAALDEVLWEDFITFLDPQRKKKQGYAPTILADESLASIRNNPGLKAILEKYKR